MVPGVVGPTGPSGVVINRHLRPTPAKAAECSSWRSWVRMCGGHAVPPQPGVLVAEVPK